MNLTKTFYEIASIGVTNYLEKNKDWIEDVGEPLAEYKQTSVMINCYIDEESARVVPIYEFENNGHITQFDNFDEAFRAFKKGVDNHRDQ